MATNTKNDSSTAGGMTVWCKNREAPSFPGIYLRATSIHEHMRSSKMWTCSESESHCKTSFHVLHHPVLVFVFHSCCSFTCVAMSLTSSTAVPVGGVLNAAEENKSSDISHGCTKFEFFNQSKTWLCLINWTHKLSGIIRSETNDTCLPCQRSHTLISCHAKQSGLVQLALRWKLTSLKQTGVVDTSQRKVSLESRKFIPLTIQKRIYGPINWKYFRV